MDFKKWLLENETELRVLGPNSESYISTTYISTMRLHDEDLKDLLESYHQHRLAEKPQPITEEKESLAERYHKIAK